MAFKLDEFIHDLFTNSTVKKVVQNPIITAIIIVILFVIIAHFMFHDDELEGWGWAKRLIKFGIYGAAVTIPVVFLHYKNSEDDYNKRVYGRSEQDLMREVEEVVQPVPPVESDVPAIGAAEPLVKTEALAPVLSRPATEATAPVQTIPQAPQVQVVVQAPQPAVRSPARPILKTPVANKN